MGWLSSKSDARDSQTPYDSVEALPPLDTRRLSVPRDAWEYIKKTFSRCCPTELMKLDGRTSPDLKSVFVRCEPDVEIILDLLVGELQYARGKVQELTEEVNIQKASANSFKEEWQAAKRKLELRTAQHTTELSEARTRHQTEVADVHTDYQRRGLELIDKHQQEIADLQVKSQEREYDLITQHSGTVADMEFNYGTTIRDMSNKQAEQERQIREDHNRQLEQMTKDHESRVNRFAQEVDGLSAALIDQDNSYQASLGSAGKIPRLGDDLIKARYQELSHYVDTLVSLEWRNDQTVWTDQQLYDLAPDQKSNRLKGYILGDTLWFYLHQYIFCSPFRVFGDEGQSLEKRWNESYGQDNGFDNKLYVWPKTGIEAERWRYETIRECRMALIQPTSAHDPRAKLKRGFKTSTENLKSAIKSTLDELVYLSPSNIETVNSLVLRAANVWLEFGMQRYRIVMTLFGSRSQPVREKVRGWRREATILTIAPTLERYGNAKGYDLGNAVVVAGCEGHDITLHGYGSVS